MDNRYVTVDIELDDLDEVIRIVRESDPANFSLAERVFRARCAAILTTLDETDFPPTTYSEDNQVAYWDLDDFSVEAVVTERDTVHITAFRDGDCQVLVTRDIASVPEIVRNMTR